MLRAMYISWVLLLIFLAGCSGGTGTPVVPESGEYSVEKPQGAQSTSERIIWGVWGFELDAETGEIVAVPNRDLAAHYDITQMVISPACQFCFSMTILEHKPAEKYVKIRIALWNKTQFTGYDVRGIVVSNAEGLSLRNPDGFTDIWDDGGPIEINPFLAFAKEQDWREFPPELKSILEFELDYETTADLSSAALVIDASYPGNCREPYGIDWFGQEWKLPAEGGSVDIWVSVFDWQDDPGPVYLDASSVGGGIVPLTKGSGYLWWGIVASLFFNDPGLHEIWVKAESPGAGWSVHQSFELEVAEGVCTPGGDDIWEDATLLPLFSHTYQYVCPSDMADWYTFDIENYLTGYLSMRVVLGNDPFFCELYSDPEGEPHITVQVPPGDQVNKALTALGLGPGTYYIKIRYGGDDPGFVQYELSVDSEDSLCYPDGNETYEGAVEISTGSNSGLQLACTFDPEDWFVFELDSGPHPTLEGDVLTSFGDIWEVTLYDQFQAQDPDGPNIASSGFEGNFAFDLNGLSLGPGQYFLRVTADMPYLAYAEYNVRLGIDVYEWGRSDWYIVSAEDLDITSNNDLYICGSVGTNSDLDFGPGMDIFNGVGSTDSFMLMADTDGNYNWGAVWGSSYADAARGVSTDLSGDIYVAGIFNGSIDLDPGAGLDSHYSKSDSTYLSKFDPSGNYLGGVTFGYMAPGTYCRGEDIYRSATDGIYICGSFQGMVDFNPGDGVELRESETKAPFLCKFDTASVFEWVATWDGSSGMEVTDMTGGSSGDIYVTGVFTDDTDMDPGPEIDIHTGLGEADVFFSRFDEQGNYYWALSWGGVEEESVPGIGVTDSGEILVVGSFTMEVDFDPGPAVDERLPWQSETSRDAFLNRFDTDGNYLGVLTWGGKGTTSASKVVADGSGDIYMYGDFSSWTDFDPGDGTDYHQAGYHNQYLLRLAADGSYRNAIKWGAVGYGQTVITKDLKLDASGDVYVLGLIDTEFDMDPGPSVDMSDSFSFLSKFSFPD